MSDKIVTRETAKKVREALDEKYVIEGEYSPGTIVKKSLLTDNFDTKMVLNDKSAFNYRPTASMGSMSLEVGTPCKVKSIIGGSLGFDQVIGISSTPSGTINDVTFTNNNDGSWTINGTASANTALQLNTNFTGFISGHKYLISGLVSGVYLRDNYSNAIGYISNGIVTMPSISGRLDLALYVTKDAVFNNSKVVPQAFNLTTTFGSDIANYISTLEQGSAGAGIAWFRRYFPKSHYPFTPIGSFINVQTRGKKYVGFNQWDEEWEVGEIGADGTNIPSASQIRSKNYIRVIPNTTYYFRASSNYNWLFAQYGSDYTQIRQDVEQTNNTFTTSPNTYYIRFHLASAYGTTYKHDININFHYDGERDGEYEQHNTRTIAIDPVELIGIPQLDGNGNLYFEGNKYNSDGSVEENYEELNASEMTFTYRSDYGIWVSSNIDVVNLSRAMTTNYVWVGKAPNELAVGEMCTRWSWCGSTPALFVNNGSDSTAPEGKFIIQKQTPTTSEATPFDDTQPCDNWGTEEFLPPIDDTRVAVVPVGHDTDYLPDYKAKTESSADMPAEDGDYVLNHDGTEEGNPNKYVPLGAWLSANGYAKLPISNTPSSNGTYVLKATYQDGTITYSWVAEEGEV